MLAKRAATRGSPVSASRSKNDVAKTSPAPVGSTSRAARGGILRGLLVAVDGRAVPAVSHDQESRLGRQFGDIGIVAADVFAAQNDRIGATQQGPGVFPTIWEDVSGRIPATHEALGGNAEQ